MTELWSEKFEWFGPSPIEPFNLVRDDVSNSRNLTFVRIVSRRLAIFLAFFGKGCAAKNASTSATDSAVQKLPQQAWMSESIKLDKPPPARALYAS